MRYNSHGIYNVIHLNEDERRMGNTSWSVAIYIIDMHICSTHFTTTGSTTTAQTPFHSFVHPNRLIIYSLHSE